MATKVKSIVEFVSAEQIAEVKANNLEAFNEMAEALAAEIDAGAEAKRVAYAAKQAKLNLDGIGDAIGAGVQADRASKRSWQYVGDLLIMRDYRSTDIFTPTKDTPATEELLAIKAALIKYGYDEDVQKVIALPPKQRVIENDDIRAKVKIALEDEIPRFLRAIKKAMASSEDRGPKAPVRTLREQMHDDLDAWIKTLRKADESKLDFDVVDVIGALKDVKSALDGEV